jgi:hypothetical protein
MSRVVHIGKHLVELSGLHGIWVGADHICRSKITLFYLDKPTQTITYELDKHVECANDAKFLEKEKEDFKKTLTSASLK